MKLKTTGIAVLTMSCLSTSVLADDCNMELHHGLRVSDKTITIEKDNGQNLEIIDNQYLYINENQINLNEQQSTLLKSYSIGIREQAPVVMDIAKEAMSIAIQGIDMAFGELLGRDSSQYAKLMTSMEELETYVVEQFNDNGDFVLNSEFGNGDDFLGEEFEERLETAIEEIVQNSIGALLVKIGTEMMFSGGDMEAFEQRMESFGEDIEEKMELRAETIELKAEQLCTSIYKLELIENQLHQHIPEMANYDLFDVGYNNRS